jgi:hypothetical protein
LVHYFINLQRNGVGVVVLQNVNEQNAIDIEIWSGAHTKPNRRDRRFAKERVMAQHGSLASGRRSNVKRGSLCRCRHRREQYERPSASPDETPFGGNPLWRLHVSRGL